MTTTTAWDNDPSSSASIGDDNNMTLQDALDFLHENDYLPCADTTIGNFTTHIYAAVTDAFKLNMAIATICAWLVPHLAIEIAEFRLTIEKSDWWRAERISEAHRVITRTSVVAITTAVLFFAATAVAVALTTQDMDQRADYIVIGLSRCFSAAIFTLLSYKIPKWLAVYHSSKRDFGSPTGITYKHLRFNIRWSIWRHFAQVYAIMMLQFCNAQPETVPVSALIGIVVGFGVFYGIYVGRTRWRRYKRYIAVGLAGFISVCASVALGSAVYFIDDVWNQDTHIDKDVIHLVCFFGWLFLVCLPMHLILWRNTKHKENECKKSGTRISYKYKTQFFAPTVLRSVKREKEERATAQQEADLAQGEAPISIRVPLEKLDEEDGDSSETSGDKESGDTPESERKDTTPQTTSTTSAHKTQSRVVGGEWLGPALITESGNLTKDAAAILNKRSYDETEREKDVINKSVRQMEEAETTMSLCNLHCCGHAESKGEREPKTVFERIVQMFKWAIALFVNFLCLYLVIVNIGATQQMKAVRANLPPAFEFLYPPEYNDGPMCAWSEASENADIRTFDTLQEVYDANYTVAHCGACSNCSNWNDLGIQWTTQRNLAKMSQECAKKSLTGGEEDVQRCNEEHLGFTEKCAACWTEDELCAKKNCVFIFLQGVMINNIGNFVVGLEHITSATCDEAMCGPRFVPCSGTTRRRMNIKSDIPRPYCQQCRVIEQDWQQVFGDPDPEM